MRTNIKSYPATFATQRAVWSTYIAGVKYTAAVTRSEHTQDHKRGWAWELAVSPLGYIGFHYTGAQPSELIYVPEFAGKLPDSEAVLATLASFVFAWAEALDYGDENSENAYLFPKACERFTAAAEQFALDTMDESEVSA